MAQDDGTTNGGTKRGASGVVRNARTRATLAGRGLTLGVAALALAACTGTNLDAGLMGTGLAPATMVAAATPEDAVLPPAAVPEAGDAIAAAAASAGAADTATQADETVPDAAAAIAAVAAPPSLAAPAVTATAASPPASAPLPPTNVPSTARSTAREKPFRLLALAPTETRRQKREAFRARAERANLVAPRRARGERQTRIIRPSKPAARASGALPGVRKRSSIFEIGKPRTNDGARSFRVASAAGLARLSGAGLKKQTAHVQTECFKPGLVAALRQAERHFGKPVMVTSGYRSPRGNSRAGGAKGSKHVSCEAADVQIDGVSKWTLAKYFRSLPGRGGVGTYCHTKSVHYDIGSKRDWNWGCRKKRR